VVKEFKSIINDKRYLFMFSYLMKDNMGKKIDLWKLNYM
jgi:hypothetical protein